MPTEESTLTTTRLRTAQTLDTARVAGDPFKLPTLLRTDVNADLAELEATDSATAPAEGGRAGAVAAQRAVLTELGRQLRGGYRGIAALDETTLTEGQRLQVYESYGWSSGEIGRLDDTRVLGLARLAGTVSAVEAGNALWLYTAARLGRIAAQLAIYDAAESASTGADSQFATMRRDAALENAGTTLGRVRFFYCSATRDADKTPELARIGYQPRRDPGEAGGGGESSSSSSSSSSSAEIPAVPVEVTLTPGAAGSGELVVAATLGAGTAEVKVFQNPGAEQTLVGTFSTLPQTLSFGTGEEVTLALVALNAAGSSAASEPATATAP